MCDKIQRKFLVLSGDRVGLGDFRLLFNLDAHIAVANGSTECFEDNGDVLSALSTPAALSVGTPP